MRRSVACTVNGQRGEYTGFAFMIDKHMVSMYNGSVLKLEDPYVIVFDNVKDTRFMPVERRSN